jgi:hypothetical protein
MRIALSGAIVLAATLSLAESTAAQNCYTNQHQCFSFAPQGSAVERMDTGLGLRSERLKITGDLRLKYL